MYEKKIKTQTKKMPWELAGLAVSGCVTGGIVALLFATGMVRGLESIFILMSVLFLSFSFIAGISLMVLWEMHQPKGSGSK